jgi:hypothetical protein
MSTRLFSFIADLDGPWAVTSQETLVGQPWHTARTLHVAAGTPVQGAGLWLLRGITSNERYVERDEKQALVARQQGLGRPASTCAALIPIRKSAAWWALTQDERRQVFEAQSRHIQIGMNYLPAIARRLHHCRDLSEDEPFDFLTWFEFDPASEGDFNRMLDALRATPEWSFVDREVDIRLKRRPG